MFAAATSPELKTDLQQALNGPWLVVLHDDPVNLMSYVVFVLRKVFGFDLPTAETHMMQVHQEGLSVVWRGERETAEHYVHQLHRFQLKATLREA